MFTSIKSLYGALGVMLFLVALYLVLEHGNDASNLINSGTNGLATIFKTLQAR